MAWVRDSAITLDESGTNSSITGAMPTHESGDVLFAWFTKDNSTAGGATSESGSWTQVGSDLDNSGTKAALYRLTAASSSETAPVISTSDTDEMTMIVVSVADVDTADIVEASGTDSSSAANRVQMPAATTSNDDCLVLYFHGGENNRQVFWDPGVMDINQVQSSAPRLSASAGWSYQKTAGAVFRPNVNLQAADDVCLYTLAVNSSADVAPPYSDTTNVPSDLIHPLHSLTTYKGGATVDPTGTVTTVDGLTTTYEAYNVSSSFGVNPYMAASNIRNTTVGGVTCNVISITSIDLSGKHVICHSKSETQDRVLDQGSVDTTGVVFGLRSNAGTAYRIWPVAALDSIPNTTNYITYVVDVDDADLCVDTYGTWDSTDVDGMFFGVHRVGGDCRVKYSSCYSLNTAVLLGGSSGKPGLFSTFETICNSPSLIGVTVQGSSQVFSFQSLQIGNGSEETYFSDELFSLEFPTQSTGKAIAFKPDPNNIGLTLYGVSGDTISIKNGTISGGSKWNFDIHASATSAATWDLSGLSIINATVTLRDVFTAAGSMSFIQCDEVTMNDADLSGGCTFDSTTGSQAVTINGATQAALQLKLDDLANCTFLSNAVAIRVEYTGTGDISLNFDGITWTGNTVDIHYNSTNSSGSNSQYAEWFQCYDQCNIRLSNWCNNL